MARKKSGREKIIDAAERLFAEKGFRAVIVRAITKAAGVNVASVNYHFGSKENLYLQVIREKIVPRAVKVREHFENLLKQGGNSTLESIIRSLCLSFLKGPISGRVRLTHQQFMAREIAHPTRGFRIIADEVVRPLLTLLVENLKPHLPDGIGDTEVTFFAMSVFAQVHHFSFTRHLTSQVVGQEFDDEFIDFVVEHIVNFSTGRYLRRDGE
ncbi:MAG: TetR/AcrR family transcriptional regulator [Deltaproteobacteria bacterium]|nr:MAG: TetR/AcrR family transcriptional regulator [Deltaproteobacteria bacterium]